MDEIPRRIESPPAALWLMALGSLLVFPIAAAVYCYGPVDLQTTALDSLLTWSALVLSFLGGVRWGLESREPRPRAHRLFFSVLSAVAGWVVLMARGRLDDGWILGAFLAAFMIQWLFDHQTPDTPSRYPMLSTVLTGGACVSLAWALEQAIHG